MPPPTTLLIVDDNPIDHELIRRLLSQDLRQRYVFYEAELATTALEIAATTPIDCILLDYNLPDGDGLEVLAELCRDEGGLTQIPVVVFTGLGDEAVAVQALQAGAMDYLAKDRLTGPHLTRAISEAIRHHSLRADLQRRQRYLERHAAELEERVATLQTQLGAALQASQDRLALATRSAGLGIWDWDIVANTLTWDERMYELYGITPETFGSAYEAWLNGLHPDDRAEAERVSLRTRRGEQEYDTEFRVCHPNGQVRVLKAHAIVQRDPNGEALRMIGVNFDITALKQTEELLRQANRDMAHAARMKDEFLANMSHELRTPLNAILGFSESLMEQIQGPLTERQQVALHHIEASGRHLLTLINDILDLSKVEAGRLELQIEPVAIAGVCQSSLLFVKETALKKRLRVSVSLEDPLAVVEADQQRLKQMLVNLLSNAVKFTPNGGAVRLEVTTDAEAGLVHFTVEDTGIGIAPDDLGRLFQPFSQLDPALNREHEGTGLGLALVRRLAELHGGEVMVESEPGRGSRFTIALPSREPPKAASPAQEQAALSEPPADVKPEIAVDMVWERLLLAEDNETNIETLSDYLSARGYEVFVARDGYEALARADEVQPQLILMDIQMPQMDGLETIRRLRTLPSHMTTPIIALTALAMPGDRERCLAAGANEYLTKPVRLRALVESIRQLLDR